MNPLGYVFRPTLSVMVDNCTAVELGDFRYLFYRCRHARVPGYVIISGSGAPFTGG